MILANKNNDSVAQTLFFSFFSISYQESARRLLSAGANSFEFQCHSKVADDIVLRNLLLSIQQYSAHCDVKGNNLVNNKSFEKLANVINKCIAPAFWKCSLLFPYLSSHLSAS